MLSNQKCDVTNHGFAQLHALVVYMPQTGL